MDKAIETLIKRHRFSAEDKKLLMQIGKNSNNNNNSNNEIISQPYFIYEDTSSAEMYEEAKAAIEAKRPVFFCTTVDSRTYTVHNITPMGGIFNEDHIWFRYDIANTINSMTVYTYVVKFYDTGLITKTAYTKTIPEDSYNIISDSINLKYLLNPHIIENGATINTDLVSGTTFKTKYLNTALYKVFDFDNSGMVLNPYSITESEIICKVSGGEIVVTIADDKYVITSNIAG